MSGTFCVQQSTLCFYEPKVHYDSISCCSLSRPKEAATGPYSDAVASSPHHHTIFLSINFLSTPTSPNQLKFLWISHLSIRATRLVHITFFDLVTVIFGEELKLWSSWVCNFFWCLVISCLSCQAIFLNFCLLDTLNLWSLLSSGA